MQASAGMDKFACLCVCVCVFACVFVCVCVCVCVCVLNSAHSLPSPLLLHNSFPFYLSGRKYTECTTDGGRGDGRAWCFTEPTSELSSQAKWGFCSDGSETKETWGYQCDCEPGFEGHRCERACAEGTYGRNCLGSCDCKHGADCNPVTGECT